MKRLFLWVFIAAFLFQGSAAAIENGSPLRLHIVADSDDKEAQDLKLKIRDAILLETQTMLADAKKSEDAYEIIARQIRSLRLCARKTALNEGYTGAIRVKLVRESFPARRYGDVLLPEGAYRALRVEIGEAEGHNWWCVLFPSLCLYGEDGGGEIRFYSSIRTWLKRFFEGE